VVSAQNETLCSKYTSLLFQNDTAENQLLLISSVVNLAVLGNETQGVPGILAADGGLTSYFTGENATTNRNNEPTKVNFLDGADELPNPPTDSNTYILLSHLYQFFGALLGCNAEGFPAYEGVADMYELHKFMFLDEEENGYFIGQVGASASAFGVTEEDVTTIGTVLDEMFNRRCTPPLESDIEFLNGTNPSICQAPSCQLADNPICPSDMMVQGPSAAPAPTATDSGSTGSSTSSSSKLSISFFGLFASSCLLWSL